VKLLQRIKAWWAKHRPIVSRKEYDELAIRHRYAVSSYQRENEEERKRLKEILGAFIGMKVIRVEGYSWNLSVLFSDEIVNRFAIYDSTSIRYLARQLAAKIEEELMTINFARVHEYARWYPAKKWQYDYTPLDARSASPYVGRE
jgi:hypothetical protein